MNCLRVLKEKNEISEDCIMMIGEMYLQKGAQYQGEEYVGPDEQGQLYKRTIVFMIILLKNSFPYVI